MSASSVSPDFDDDFVAAACDALRAAPGQVGAAWWAASRAHGASLNRVESVSQPTLSGQFR